MNLEYSKLINCHHSRSRVVTKQIRPLPIRSCDRQRETETSNNESTKVHKCRRARRLLRHAEN